MRFRAACAAIILVLLLLVAPSESIREAEIPELMKSVLDHYDSARNLVVDRMDKTGKPDDNNMQAYRHRYRGMIESDRLNRIHHEIKYIHDPPTGLEEFLDDFFVLEFKALMERDKKSPEEAQEIADRRVSSLLNRAAWSQRGHIQFAYILAREAARAGRIPPNPVHAAIHKAASDAANAWHDGPESGGFRSIRPVPAALEAKENPKELKYQSFLAMLELFTRKYREVTGLQSTRHGATDLLKGKTVPNEFLHLEAHRKTYPSGQRYFDELKEELQERANGIERKPKDFDHYDLSNVGLADGYGTTLRDYYYNMQGWDPAYVRRFVDPPSTGAQQQGSTAAHHPAMPMLQNGAGGVQPWQWPHGAAGAFQPQWPHNVAGAFHTHGQDPSSMWSGAYPHAAESYHSFSANPSQQGYAGSAFSHPTHGQYGAYPSEYHQQDGYGAYPHAAESYHSFPANPSQQGYAGSAYSHPTHGQYGAYPSQFPHHGEYGP